MNVRQKFLGGLLAVGALVALTGAVVLGADAESTRRAAITEAEQVARGIAKDIVVGLPLGGDGPLLNNPAALEAYLHRLHDLQQRDIEVVDAGKTILADVVPEDVGTRLDTDSDNQVGKTIADGKPRTFVETSADYPDGIQQIAVPLVDEAGATRGAIVLEYTPIYQEMTAATRGARTMMIIAGVVCIVLILLLGLVVAESVTRRIRSLTRAVSSIRDANYSQRVETGGRDEISRLGDAFNDMADRLERSAREILAKEYTDSILDSAGEGICGVDAQDRITFANTAAGRITGLGVEGLLDRDASAVLPDADRPAGDSAEREGTLQRPDGTSVRVAYTVSPIAKDGRRIGAVIVMRDVTRQRALEHDLRHQALHDALTGLPNRKLFLDRVDHAITRARATLSPAAVLYLDLDGFKKVNDSLGHNAGDALLRTTAERLAGALRPQDTVARLGGDEFAVLLEDVSSVEEVAQSCLDALARPFLVQGRQAVVSVSIGIVADAGRHGDAEEVLRDADVAMYAAKSAGKNCYQIYETRMHEQLMDRLDSETRLRQAVHNGELRLHLQPVVSVPDRRVAGVEALVRWADPERGLQAPGTFIPLAEETGLITEIDRWVLLEACRTVHAWQQTSPETAPAWVSVNLSAANFEVPDLTERIAYALTTSGLSPHSLVLELTETVLMRDIAVTSARLEELRALGVRIAIDDFGTGYSSLGYLRDIPVDVLKVDRSFVTGLASNPRQQELVSAVLQLGHTLGLKVVAEGVETEAQLRVLARIGCQFAQGYHTGRPEPADHLVALV
ncbi:EAL domain-containing protein [Actinoplanes sp. TBRC 11911]|uniref:putative bifunctional diguanylate cyclase/phosphodiesterase n=1 Tax=Actinoplanes sp. TBRC 11911 TaxID=2729386 RepID=UPI00145CEBD5|nr:EAL domain-containing protein [Actinoplanes sp. TBRC 11911]NMO56410.1 EAL domain-containing protein [Actinoplanes sp. TBRC 11911]